MKPLCLFGLVLALLLGACGCKPSFDHVKKSAENSPTKSLGAKATITTSTDESAVVWAQLLEVRKDGRAYLMDTNATFSGRVMDFYELEGGEGMIQTHFKEGRRYGSSRWWHWNGKLAGTVNYVSGKEEGVETWWYEDNQKMRELTYKQGKLQGPANAWHDNGKQEFSAAWKNGEPEGKFTEWYSSGKMMTTRTYAAGKREGIETHWYENGQKAWELNWLAGQEQGVRTEWYENGKKTSETPFKDGKRHGKATGWYQNGKKSLEITCDAGKETRHLEWSESGASVDLTEEGWNPDGTPRKTK